MTTHDQLAPGVVQVRLSGHPGDADALTAILAAHPAVQILTGPDGPYPNRRQHGSRYYLTLQLIPPPSPQQDPPPGPAGTQAARRVTPGSPPKARR